MEPKGGVIANGQIKDNLSLGNSAWTASSNVTATADTTDKKEGTGSSDLSVAAAFATGLLAYEDTASVVDLTDQTQASFWIKSSTTTVAGQLELVLDESTGCASPDPQTPRSPGPGSGSRGSRYETATTVAQLSNLSLTFAILAGVRPLNSGWVRNRL